MTKLVDTNGNGPMWKPGDRVWVAPLKIEATVIKQHLSYDGEESFLKRLKEELGQLEK